MTEKRDIQDTKRVFLENEAIPDRDWLGYPREHIPRELGNTWAKITLQARKSIPSKDKVWDVATWREVEDAAEEIFLNCVDIKNGGGGKAYIGLESRIKLKLGNVWVSSPRASNNTEVAQTAYTLDSVE